MPILTILGLVFGGIKLLMAIIQLLHEHPEITAEAKALIAKAVPHTDALHGYVEQAVAAQQTVAERDVIEAP